MPLVTRCTERCKRLAVSMIAALIASAGLFVLPSASAAGGVTVTPGEYNGSCDTMFRTITNGTDQTVYVQVYETSRGRRVDYPFRVEVASGESYVTNSENKRYFGFQSFGVKTAMYVFPPGLPPTLEWTDWGPTEKVAPAGCPPMIAAAKYLPKRTKTISEKSRPLIWFKAKAHSTDFGYRVAGSNKIRWAVSFVDSDDDGLNIAPGPVMEPGERVLLKFYSRNRDDYDDATDPVYLGKERFTRLR